MANNDATIIVGKLSDEELKKSIDKLVGEIATANQLIRKDFDETLNHVQKTIRSMGDIKINSGGASDAGSSRRTSVLKNEEQTVNNLTISYDKFAKAQQVAVRTASTEYRNADTLETMKIQLELLRQRLIETRQQYSSFVAMAANATRTGDEGLYKFATANVHAFETEAKSLIRQIRTVQTSMQQMGEVIAPQGHTIQNMANSIGKMNPELALLTEFLKSGKIQFKEFAQAEAETESKASGVTSEIKKQAQAIREMEGWKKKGVVAIGDDVYYDPERSNMTRRERAKLLTLEEQIAQKIEERIFAEEKENREIQRAKEEEQQRTTAATQTLNIEKQITDETKKQSAPKGFASYDSLRESIAHVLQIQQAQVKLVDTETSSYIKLDSTLKQLKQTYDRLSASERNSEQGKALIASMHEVENALRSIRQQASRPVNLQAALGLSEKTLDDISYKMQRLASYRSGLDVNVRRAEIREVNAEYDRLKKKMDEVMQKNQQMIAGNNALTRSWNYMKNRLAFYFTVGASTQLIKNLIEVRSQYEMNERALGILIGSAERGTQVFRELSQMALVSPYTLIELSSAAKQLTAYDIAAKDVVDTTRRLADMASAVGVPMERLTYALGQIKAYGYLNSRDARMFANAGIPLVKQLSDYYTQLEGKMVSVGDVYDRMKKKAIDFNSVMAVVTKMTDEGGKFFDFQAKMADTLKVRLANLTLAWNNMLNEMGAETQGVLTSVIGGLKSLFAHWKAIDNMLKTIAWTFGLAKFIRIIQIANISLAAFGKQIAWNAIVGRKLSAALFSLAGSMKALVTSPLTWWTLLAVAATSATIAIWNMNEAQKSLNKTLRDGAKDRYENLERFFENYDSVRKSLYKTITDAKTGETKTETIDIDRGEAIKAWEAIREQIELSAHASDDYIAKLVEIGNISERVRSGFEVLDEIKIVSAALKELSDDAIKVDTDWSAWWNANLLPDSWVENLKDYQKELDNVRTKYENVAEARARWKQNKFANAELNEDFVDLDRSLVKLQEDLQITAQSVYDFLSLKGWDKDETKINEVFRQIQDKLIQEGNLDPQQGFVLQTQWEEARARAAKIALQYRIEDEKEALKVASDEEAKNAIQTRLDALQEQYDDFEKFNGKSKAYWENFTKWLKEQHLSETTEMFRGMDAEQIKSLNFQEGKYGDWVTRMVTKYAKEHKMSYDDAFSYLRNWVSSANKWSIFIPLTISTEDKKSVYQTLDEADKAADAAWSKIKRLDERITQLKKKGAKEISEYEGFDANATDDDKEYTRALQEKADAQKDYNKAIAEGGHSKKEDAAATKAQKQAESELQKALKEELQLIDKVRSSYKELTDSGMNHFDAIVSSTSGFDESVNNINRSLTKFGLEKLDLSKFAGVTNPKDLVDLLEKQLNKLMTSGAAKPAEIQDLQVKVRDLKLDVEKFNQKTFTESLNNELSRLKDEYELAVSLDADPELGNTFAEMMGINVDTLPRTVEEYANEYTKLLNKYLGEKKAGIELPHLNLTNDDLRSFEEMVKVGTLNKEVYENIKKGVEDVRNIRKKDTDETIKDWNKLIEKYGEYEAKVNKLRNDAAKERATFVSQYGTKAQKGTAVRLLAEIQAEHDPNEKQKLIEQLKSLVDQIAGNDQAKLKIKVAIDNSELQGGAKYAFEEFQKSPEWITATGDLSGMTKKALGFLIDELERYKKSARHLDPKQIKQINNALKQLYTAQKKNNPFGALSISMHQAKERADNFNPKIEETREKIKLLEKETKQEAVLFGQASDEKVNAIKKAKEELQRLLDLQKQAGELSSEEKVSILSSIVSYAKTLASIATDITETLGNGDTTKAINNVVEVFDKTSQYAQIGQQIGGSYGAIIGGIAGYALSMGKLWYDTATNEEMILEDMEESSRVLKEIERTYRKLESAMSDAYGTAEIGAKKALMANKELQLTEYRRQLNLEESRASKNKDTAHIEELKDKISELEIELRNTGKELVNDLMGISSVGDAAEQMVSSMITAFKNGEDYMKSFRDSFDSIIDNLIMKSIVGKVVGQKIEQLFKEVEKISTKRADEMMISAADVTEGEIQRYLAGSSERTYQEWAKTLEYWISDSNVSNEDKEKYKKWLEHLRDIYTDAVTPTAEDIEGIQEKRDEWESGVKDIFDAYMKAFGIEYGQDAAQENGLSALQQGIQGITEDTAGALEAYMNGVSQQVYYQSDILTQIRDAVVMMDGDVQLGTQAQMLLQLQQSYAVQMAIQSILEGWSAPNGMAVRVEMN